MEIVQRFGVGALPPDPRQCETQTSFSFERAFRSEIFLLDFFSKILTADMKTNFTKFELSTTFRL